MRLMDALQTKSIFRMGHQSPDAGYLRIDSPPADAVAALWRLMDKFDDLLMDFCDASLVYLASSLKIDRIATANVKDFSVYCLPGNKRFCMCWMNRFSNKNGCQPLPGLRRKLLPL